MNRQKITEAKKVAQRTLDLLDQAGRELKSARNWGIYDMLGGKMLSSLIKHSKVGKAESLLRAVQDNLHQLQKKLGDVNVELDPALRVSEFEAFIDIAFDNIISDWFVQSKIKGSLRDVERLQMEVRRIVTRLERLERDTV